MTAARDEAWIPGTTFAMGSDRHYPEEAPVHHVAVDGFGIDTMPVTNQDFAEFITATGHLTVAERPLDPSRSSSLNVISTRAPAIAAPIVAQTEQRDGWVQDLGWGTVLVVAGATIAVAVGVAARRRPSPRSRSGNGIAPPGR